MAAEEPKTLSIDIDGLTVLKKYPQFDDITEPIAADVNE